MPRTQARVGGLRRSRRDLDQVDPRFHACIVEQADRLAVSDSYCRTGRQNHRKTSRSRSRTDTAGYVLVSRRVAASLKLPARNSSEQGSTTIAVGSGAARTAI